MNAELTLTIVRRMLDARLGDDPGTLNFLYPFNRFLTRAIDDRVVLEDWRTQLAQKTRGVVYCHVPFCPAHCTFCGFSTTFGLQRDRVRSYVDAVEAEGCRLRDLIPLDNLVTEAVFIGGGTPNYLDPDEFVSLARGLRASVRWDDSAEWTVEIYPSFRLAGDVLRAMRDIGVNRISLAAQDFNDDVLKRARRQYSAQEGLDVAEKIQKLGFARINVDLMLGIPGQSMQNATANFEALRRLRPSHITLNPYSSRSPLIPLRSAKYRPELISLSEIRNLYTFYRDWLLERGYRQVGKTNFERLDAPAFRYESLVRSSSPRLGMGCNALSFTGSSTYRNVERLDEYGASVRMGRLPLASFYELRGGDAIRAAAFYEVLGGMIDLLAMTARFGHAADEIILPLGSILVEYGLAHFERGRLVLTEDGVWNLGIVQRAFLPTQVLQSIVQYTEPSGAAAS